MPTTRAVRLHAHGSPLTVEEVELPEPGAGEVLVDLAFGGVNPIDRYVAAGRVAADAPLPRTLGGEASGHLDGDPVVVSGEGLGALRGGVWAQRAVVPREAVVPVPAGLSLEAAAGAAIAGSTAYAAVVALADVRPGDRVLVLGASGGTGLATVSLAASIGATVWGQTGSEAKAAAIRAAGAEGAVVTDAAGLEQAARELRPTVVDPLAGDFTAPALGLLEPHGRYTVFGTTAGAKVTVDWQGLYRRSLRVLGYGGLVTPAAQRRELLEGTLRALAEGRMQLPVGRVVPMGEPDDALALLADRAVTGKVLLDLR